MAKREQKRRSFERSVNIYESHLEFKPDEFQKEYLRTMHEYPVTFVDEPSGTGKTTLAVHKGFDFLRKGIAQQIVYLRFPDDRFLKRGFLPGTDEEKDYKMFTPFFDALDELGVQRDSYRSLKEKEQIILTTDCALRGTNLKYTFLIIDEAQNAKDFADLQLVLTRLHDEGGRAVVIGHSGQQDNRHVQRTAKLKLTPFQAYAYHFTKKPFARSVRLENNYRGEISKWADAIGESLAEL